MASPLLKYIDHVTLPIYIGSILREDGSLAGVSYSSYRPKEQTKDLPRITWRRLSRIPGKGPTEHRKGRYRKSFVNEDGVITEIWAQAQQTLFQFDIIAESGEEADHLMVRFQDLIVRALPSLQAFGVSDMIFEEEVGDDMLSRTQDDPFRGLRYRVYHEALEFKTPPRIEGIELNLLSARVEEVEEIVRGGTALADESYDLLGQTHLESIIHVSDYSNGIIARTDDYVHGVDYIVHVDKESYKAAIEWLQPGRKPAMGATYYVRYRHYSPISVFHLPASES